jgi:hypothetical protein
VFTKKCVSNYPSDSNQTGVISLIGTEIRVLVVIADQLISVSKKKIPKKFTARKSWECSANDDLQDSNKVIHRIFSPHHDEGKTFS